MMFSELLATTYPSIRVQPNLIFARDGNVYSSGGVTAGIDLALALVEEDLSGNPARRRPDDGGFSPAPRGAIPIQRLLKVESKNRPDIGELQAWIRGHPGEPSRLGGSHGHEPAQVFAALAARPEAPTHFTERAQADAARCKLEQSVLPGETIAKECGFGNAERMRRTFQRHLDVSPHDYRARFRSTLLN